MKFQLRPILDEMKSLYEKPISPDRFKEYIAMLQGGTKGDLALPISGFNPMAKDHLLEKIAELQSPDAESVMSTVIAEVNKHLPKGGDRVIQVVLNLADDLKGGWTNRFSTDYDSKFKLNAFVERDFCVPYFWTSETYSVEMLTQRTQAQIYRTIYWLENPKPRILADLVAQERYVASKLNLTTDVATLELKAIADFYEKHKQSDEYDLLFNFFYGDKASETLGYKCHGVKDVTGFDYVKV